MRKSINESGADAIELASRRRRGGHDSADAPQRFGLCTGARIERRLDVAHGLGPGAHDRRAQRVAHERADGLPAGACVEIKILRRVRADSMRRPPRHRRDACSMAAALCSIYECRRSDTFTRSRRSLPVRRARTHHSHTHNGATPPRRSRVSTPCRHEDLVPHRSTEARTAASSPRNDLVKNCRCTRRTG